MDTSHISVNDLAKACACSADAAEWEEFLRRAMPLVSLVASRVCRLWTGGVAPAIVGDIAQEVFLKLCEQERRILRDFEPRGEDSFFGLLRIVSASVANDYFRRFYSVKRGGKVVTIQLEEGAETSTAASTGEAGRMQQSVLLLQLDQMLREAPEFIGERDRSIFWLYYLQGFTAEEIAAGTGSLLSAKGVESALRRVSSWLRGKMKERTPESLIRNPREETAT